MKSTKSHITLINKLHELHPEYVFQISDKASETIWKKLSIYYSSNKTKQASISDYPLVYFGNTVKLPTGISKFNPVQDQPLTASNITDWMNEAEFVSIVKNIVEDIKALHTAEAAVKSKADSIICGTCNKIETQFVALSVGLMFSKYSSADKELFSWFCKDPDANLYIKSKYGLVPIHFTAEDGKVSEGSEFWSKFFKTYRPKLLEWIQFARDMFLNDNIGGVDATRLRRTIENNEELGIIDKLHTQIPKCILNNSFAKLDYEVFEDKQTGEERKRRVNADLWLRLSSSAEKGVPNTEDNWIAIFKNIIPMLDSSEFEISKRYTTDRKVPSIWYYDPSVLTEVKDMPKTWEKFFRHKFSIDKEAQLYRICKFLTLLLQENNQNRQALVIASKGRTGKSLFCEVLMKSFNKMFGCLHSNVKYAVDICSEAFVDGQAAKGGLDKIMDSMLVYIPDVSNTSELINTAKLKALTGSDPLTSDIKFKAPVKKTLYGTKVIISTNAVTRMADAASSSRVLPVWFTRSDNEADYDMHDMAQAMIEEFPQFLAYSYSYCKYIEQKFNIPASVSYRSVHIFSSDDPNRELKEVYESLGESKKFFMYHTAADWDADEDDFNSQIAELAGVEASHDSKTTSVELHKAINNALEELDLSNLRSSFAASNNKYFKSFKKFLENNFGCKYTITNGVRYYTGIRLRSVSETISENISRRCSVKYKVLNRSRNISDEESTMPC